jgi:hypothetical protein
MLVPNEDLYSGIQIDSSDVGRSILTVQNFIYKKVCTNGLVLPRDHGILFKQKHIGISSDDFRENLVASLNIIPDLVVKSEEMIKNTTTIYYDYVFESQDGLQKFIDTLKEGAKVSDTTASNIVDLMTAKYGTNKWGLINSITEVAQNFTLERRLELEKYAGGLLVA